MGGLSKSALEGCSWRRLGSEHYHWASPQSATALNHAPVVVTEAKFGPEFSTAVVSEAELMGAC
jgi:hypothetical protein